MRSVFFSLLAACLLAAVQAVSSSGNRLLVVMDDVANKDQYSKFWSDLQSRGYALTFSTPKSDPAIFRHGERSYDHLLILPSKLKALGAQLTANILLDFVKADGNILLALSSAKPPPTTLVSLLLELDIHLPDDRSSYVVDHFNFDAISSAEKHDVILVPPPKATRADLKDYFGGEGVLALPRTVGQSISASSVLLSSILTSSSTAYSYSPNDHLTGVDELFAPGRQMSLVSAMQARNSARITVLGSAEMLEDAWIDATVKHSGPGSKDTKTANRDFATKLSAWTFKELGVLKVVELKHYLSEGKGSAPLNDTSVSREDLNPKIYRIKNDVTFSISLSEYAMDRWVPFQPPANDAVQLEFTMLSPYQRLNLGLAPSLSTPETSTFATSFKLPDQHGIFSFRINYKRPFLTVVDEKRHVTVRHFAHDEWPRSWAISGSWVWIVGVFGTALGWLAFVAVWLYSEPVDEAKRVKKTN